MEQQAETQLTERQSQFFSGLCRQDDPPWRRTYFSQGPTYALNYDRSPPTDYPVMRRRSYCPAVGPAPLRVHIDALRTSFQKVPVRLMENDTYLSVVLPEFRAEAIVILKPPADRIAAEPADQWQLGWVCALSRHDVNISYAGEGDGGKRVFGTARWEVPVMHLSTSDLTSPPWLSSDACSPTFAVAADFEGCSGRRFIVPMRCFEDRFLPLVPWKLVCNHSALYATAATFDLEYYGWLTLRNVTSDAYFVVRTIIWKRRLELDLCCHNKVGTRASMASQPLDMQTETPCNFPLPEWTVSGPSAKSELTLLYRLDHEHEVPVPCIVVQGKNYRYPQLPRM